LSPSTSTSHIGDPDVIADEANAKYGQHRQSHIGDPDEERNNIDIPTQPTRLKIKTDLPVTRMNQDSMVVSKY
jgi:hypothetical protein